MTLAVAATLALAGAVLALGLSPTRARARSFPAPAPQYRATQRYYESFGEEPVDVVVKGSLQQLLLSSDIDRLVGLEGCLSGNVPVERAGGGGGRRKGRAGSWRGPKR